MVCPFKLALSAISAVVGFVAYKKMINGGSSRERKPYDGPLRICVYGSSSIKTPKKYLDASALLGKTIAEKKLICINGGGKTGVMGAVNTAVRAAGGKTLGVIHAMWINEEQSSELDDVITTSGDGDDYGLHGRKEHLMRNSDALIAMPGGVGTFEELLEAMSMRQLNLENFRSRIPVCVVNIDGYYDGIIMQMNRAKADSLLSREIEEVVKVFTDPIEALDYCLDFIEKAGEEISSKRITTASKL